MGIGTSIFLIAVGAILRYGIDVQTEGVDLHAIGVILMVVGIIGVLVSFLFWNTWGGFGGRTTVVDDAPPVRRRRVYDDEPPVRRRRVYEDEVL